MPQPGSTALFSAAPESGFRLSPSERAEIPPIVNVDALERLLAWMRPERRAEVLSFYRELGKDGKVMLGPALGSTGNPEIDAIAKHIVVTHGAQAKRPK